MFSIPIPKPKAVARKKNKIGLSIDDYKGAPSTLCGGCGHDSVTAAIIQACYELAMPPEKVAKMSGIGCSSKTPAYFLSGAHGFNSVHGRMPAVTTGAYLANRAMHYLAVSGDGDTGSIGLSHFMHAIRRRLNMLYIVENNGVYGLTKGQFSPTSDLGSQNKKKEQNPFPAIDLAELAIQMGASFVARSFSGDKKQLVPLIKSGLLTRGFALIDVISPCVSFNNHLGSTKSYDYLRNHGQVLFEVKDLIPPAEEIHVTYNEGECKKVALHDGSQIVLHKSAEGYDLADRKAAMDHLGSQKKMGHIPTGLFFLDAQSDDFHRVNKTEEQPLRDLALADLCPGKDALARINDGFR